MAEHEKLLLSVVGHLPVLEVKFMHEGLTVKKVVKGLIPDLEKPGTQTEEASLQKWRNPACKTGLQHQISLIQRSAGTVVRVRNKPVTVAGRGSARSSHVSNIFL